MMQRSEWTTESAMLSPELSALVDELGIVRDYVDGFGQTQRAGSEAVFCMLARLGYPVRNERDAASARAERETQRNLRGLSPVTVAWAGTLDHLAFYTGLRGGLGHWRVRVQLEDGRTMVCGGAESEQQTLPFAQRRGALYMLPCRLRLPLGYHRLELEWGALRAETLVIAAPRRAPRGPKHSWGVFAPVYALRGRTAQGTGTLSELSDLCDLMRKSGGDFVATLPMMAQFLEEPFDSSPFAPASRLFWNESLLDLSVLPGLSDCAEANALFRSDAFRREQAELEEGRYVKPGRQIKLTHTVLSHMAKSFFGQRGEDHPCFRSFLSEHPYAKDYARFRAACDAHGGTFKWPTGMRSRPLRAEDCAKDRYHLHLYAQWQMNAQLAAVSERARARGMRLHLDLPLGVHAASFDMWREPECFVPGMTVGAPRDALCLEGQDWGFAPSHPEGQRSQGYRYFIAYVRNQLRYAGILRIDHVMGLHRTFCVPEGTSARDGMYLKQPHEELYAIFNLEATKAGSVLVGEDLGTVPCEVRETMGGHGMKRMYVLPFELEPTDRGTTLRPTPEGALASINTHDMPTFAGLWQGQDIDERLTRGVLDADDCVAAQAERRQLLEDLLIALRLSMFATREEALRAAVTLLAKSDAEMVLVALEDLWGELEPQNVPGTFAPERNFCRRMRYRLDELSQLTPVRTLLKTLSMARATSTALAESTVA